MIIKNKVSNWKSALKITNGTYLASLEAIKSEFSCRCTSRFKWVSFKLKNEMKEVKTLEKIQSSLSEPRLRFTYLYSLNMASMWSMAMPIEVAMSVDLRPGQSVAFSWIRFMNATLFLKKFKHKNQTFNIKITHFELLFF